MEEKRAVAVLRDRAGVVRHEDDRLAARAQLIEVRDALVPERRVPDGEHLVEEQHVGVNVDGDGECEPPRHAARVVLQLLVDEPLELGEREHLLEPRLRLTRCQPEQHSALDGVLPGRELGVEPDAEVDEGGEAAFDGDGPRIGDIDPGDAAEEGALAASVAADDPEELAAPHFEVDVAQRQLYLVLGVGERVAHAVLDRGHPLMREPERLRQR